jgi:hypothetical protein
MIGLTVLMVRAAQRRAFPNTNVDNDCLPWWFTPQSREEAARRQVENNPKPLFPTSYHYYKLLDQFTAFYGPIGPGVPRYEPKRAWQL